MSSSADAAAVPAGAYDGVDLRSLAPRLGVPRVVAFDRVGSTLDVAHALGADGAPGGTLVLADEQTAGRGRMGRVWQSPPGSGIWLTLVERPDRGDALDVLSLRLGLHAAEVLDHFAGEPVRLKWPNDLHLKAGKLAGILVEARWRDGRLDWLAVGFGLNVRPPREVPGAGLTAGTDRVAVLERLVPVLRDAVAMRGALTERELVAYRARDLAAGRRVVAPVVGKAVGIDASGALLVDTGSGRDRVRAGSLTFAEDA